MSSQDGLDHTMTVFLSGTNTTEEGAVHAFHNMREKNAVRWTRSTQSVVFKSIDTGCAYGLLPVAHGWLIQAGLEQRGRGPGPEFEALRVRREARFEALLGAGFDLLTVRSAPRPGCAFRPGM